MKILIEQHQVFFSDLLDTVFHYQSYTDIPFDWQKLYVQVADELEIIIRFLENSFSQYFNLSAKVPNPILARFEKDIRPQLSKIKIRLGEQEKNQHLIESIFGIIESHVKPLGMEAFSFHRLKYYKNLVAFLAKWNIDFYRDSKLPPLIETLLSLKFNDERFLFQVYNSLKESIAAVEPDEKQLQLLKSYYKCISQIIETANEALFPEKASPKDMVLDWLSQEIQFLEASYPKKENIPGAPAAKINTSLSVPVLALYIRLFKEAGIITNNNYQELFRVVSSTFTTHRKADVAHTHLHSKFYAIEESAKRKVFDQLMEMAHLCKRIG